MSASMNRVILVGNLTKDPELKFITSGSAVANFRMAINRKWKDAQGQQKEEVCFVGVVVWGKQAEACGEYLKKGSPVMVEGRLQFREWEKDGDKRSILEVVAERVQFLNSGKREAGQDAAPAPSAADDIPF